MKSRKSVAAVFAQEALRGFHNDPQGFADMMGGSRANSTKNTQKLLDNPNVRKVGHWSQWLALAITISS
jgi:hypothetical protein